MHRIVFALMLIGFIAGCSRPSSPLAADTDIAELPTLSTAEVIRLTKAVEQPVIIEFSVLHGCDRCARMRPEARKLAPETSDRVAIKRADFITNQPLLQSLGATVCPSYVLFTSDSPPQIHTSPQLLVAMLEDASPATDH